VGGHSHNDKLSFELHVNGRPLIVDPGSPTYTRDAAERNRYRGTGHHNTLQLDGAEQAPVPPERLFALPEAHQASVLGFKPGEEVDVLEARHLGYGRLSGEVCVTRRFHLDKARGVLGVEDRLEGQGAHRVTLRLHLPTPKARLRPPTRRELARAEAALGKVTFGPLAVEVADGEGLLGVVLLGPSWSVGLGPYDYSPGYGERTSAVRVTGQMHRELPAWERFAVVYSS
jgi:hypothetical protein